MKWMIASDIHGSAYFGAKLADRFEKEGAQRLILLGDLLYHGPRNDLPEGYAPKELIPILNGLKDRIFCVRGNCDWYLFLNPGSVSIPKGGSENSYMIFEDGIVRLVSLDGRTLMESGKYCTEQ